LLDGGIDQAQPSRQGDLGPERPQRPIGVEQSSLPKGMLSCSLLAAGQTR
jgi:hypothetical protein